MEQQDDEPALNFDSAFERPFAQNTLVFAGFSVEEEQVVFHYEHRGPRGELLCTLEPALRLPGIGSRCQSVVGTDARKALEQAITGLGMAILCYIWMGFLTPWIEVRAGAAEEPQASLLSEEQLAFWRSVLLLSLREHFFVNGVHALGDQGDSSLEDLHLGSAPGPGGERFLARGLAPSSPRHGSEDEPPRPSSSEGVGLSGEQGSRHPRRVLVPMGAGKDSTVVWELLKRNEKELGPGSSELSWFFLEGQQREFGRCWRYQALAEASGALISDVVVAELAWPQGAFERARNQALSLVGHPWACIVCFASAVVALLQGYSFVAVGNERSASLGNGVEWEGVEVNHQWDKSLAFEREAQGYLHRHCQGLVTYFSALTPLWDVQVGLLFAHFCSEYAPLILSCNDPKGPSASRWCGSCPKCAFVAAVLGAFLPVSTLRGIFGDDPFESGALIPHLDLLAGLGEEAGVDDQETIMVSATVPALARGRCRVLVHPWKPLECVGGPEETRLALTLVEKRYMQEGRRLPRLFTPARRAALCKEADGSDLTLLHDWGEAHLLPAWLEGTVRSALAEAVADFQGAS